MEPEPIDRIEEWAAALGHTLTPWQRALLNDTEPTPRDGADLAGITPRIGHGYDPLAYLNIKRRRLVDRA